MPAVAWHDCSGAAANIYFKTYDGSSWTGVGGSASPGGISTTQAASGSPSLAVDPVTGNLTLAWADWAAGDYEVCARQFDGLSWVDLGPPCVVGGVSSNPGLSEAPSVALDASGRPVVVWRDDTSGAWEIYLKFFDGGQWRELGGSASSGGIGNAGNNATCSVMVTSSGDPIVAWDDASGVNV
jgi:hypothetical protein